MNHTLKGHRGSGLVCVCQSVYICSKPLTLSSSYRFRLAECVFALDQNNPRDQLQPPTTSVYRKGLRGKLYSLVSSTYVCVCVMERLPVETHLGHVSAEELCVIHFQTQLQVFTGNSFSLYFAADPIHTAPSFSHSP